MSKSNPKTMWDGIKKYAANRLTWAVIILVPFYPGQNPLQTIAVQRNDAPSLPLIQTNMTYPNGDGVGAPSLTANAVVVQDPISRVMLYERNSATKMLPASTTKMMTALVALDLYPDLETTLTVSTEDHTLGQTMDLTRGETITARSLLAGLLIRSANDAALTLANNVPGGYDGFIKAMNNKAQELGLTDTRYKNPSGLEQYDHITTARDLSVLIGEVVRHEELTSLMLTPYLVVTDTTGEVVHELSTTDQLLGIIPGIKAAKTGFTQNAGECLVTFVEQNNQPLITVVLNSADRFGETKKLIDWAYQHHTWIVPEL